MQDREKTFVFNIQYDKKRVFYKTRNLINTKQAPAFIMTDREKSAAAGQNSFYSALTSVPMFAKFALTKTIKETTFERLIVKFKDPQSKTMADEFLKDMRRTLTPYRDQNLKVYNYANS